MTAAALTGSYVRVVTLADGTPRITLDLDCRLADLAGLALEPGAELAALDPRSLQLALSVLLDAEIGEGRAL